MGGSRILSEEIHYSMGCLAVPSSVVGSIVLFRLPKRGRISIALTRVDRYDVYSIPLPLHFCLIIYPLMTLSQGWTPHSICPLSTVTEDYLAEHEISDMPNILSG